MKWWHVAAIGAAGLASYPVVKMLQFDNYRPMIQYVKENHPYPLRIAEIGVLFGTNSVRMFNNLDVEIMYLIDPFIPYDEPNALLQKILPSSFDAAFVNLIPYLDRIVPLQMTSEEACPCVPDDLDMVYIDGNHSYEFVKKDIDCFYQKLKPGGIIGGHDILDDAYPGVTQAVLEFSEEQNIPVFIEKPEWWTIKP